MDYCVHPKLSWNRLNSAAALLDDLLLAFSWGNTSPLFWPFVDIWAGNSRCSTNAGLYNTALYLWPFNASLHPAYLQQQIYDDVFPSHHVICLKSKYKYMHCDFAAAVRLTAGTEASSITPLNLCSALLSA